MMLIPILAVLVLQNDRSHDPQQGTANPFQPDEALRRVLGNGGTDRSSAGTAQFPEDMRGLPVMHVRAIVKMASKPAAAGILEIEGYGTFPVHAGETVALTRAGQRPSIASSQAARHDGSRTASALPATASSQRAGPIVLHIDSIGFDGIVAKLGTTGEVMVIR